MENDIIFVFPRVQWPVGEYGGARVQYKVISGSQKCKPKGECTRTRIVASAQQRVALATVITWSRHLTATQLGVTRSGNSTRPTDIESSLGTTHSSSSRVDSDSSKTLALFQQRAFTTPDSFTSRSTKRSYIIESKSSVLRLDR